MTTWSFHLTTNENGYKNIQFNDFSSHELSSVRRASPQITKLYTTQFSSSSTQCRHLMSLYQSRWAWDFEIEGGTFSSSCSRGWCSPSWDDDTIVMMKSKCAHVCAAGKRRQFEISNSFFLMKSEKLHMRVLEPTDVNEPFFRTFSIYFVLILS